MAEETKETARAIVSIKDIIAKKKAQVQEKTATVYVPSLDGEITVKTPSSDDLQEYDQVIVYQFSRTRDPEVLQKVTEKLVLRNVVEPNLKDPELIEAMGCKTNPPAIVQEVFTPAEVVDIAAIMMKLAGRKRGEAVRLVDEIKN
ncbi:hypothetical protein [Aneurinibacillus migulanus]|uniref:Phage XkdN-like tail assembly chaperone protein, TAC n=1 Tax=Aneurinibacillus migulanus TaxID=47500 RepID=A0A0D1XVQ6_ANEMI|nr:hypothetical protein [Aneurinibacillus migulanus]KIV56218.1 hypothetical protein TS65_13450 [Aneurinibacillus migulanus]KON84284.1 hypothetical protein AF333_30595 [Aneurinibacillus migulanus]MED0893834.1 hypothetical protein [Aneurinibacillus migulanus]MED1614513.1 hypothetical protein [Aneurinibacillus migulanus]SDI84198.1 Phage XkdN-like tail assembly chaperone protein, TAC [Aneurinibacillus migulanus]